MTGESHFVFKKSAFVTLEGFVFDVQGEETLVKLEGCNHIRISRNVFELKTTESIKWVFVGGFWSDNTFPFQYPSHHNSCLLYTSPSPRDATLSRMPSSA